MFDQRKLQVYFIMGSNNTKQDPSIVLEQAIAGGITCFQFREKGKNAKTGKEKLKLGQKLRNICRNHHIPFIVNDDIQLAIELDADGVHVGQGDMSVNEIRKIVPDDYIIGLSTSNIKEAKEAELLKVDYIGVGAIFSTKTKADATEPMGIAGLKAIRQATSLPIVGISGINQDNAHEIIQAGADGVAVVSAISQAKNPEQAANKLKLQTIS